VPRARSSAWGRQPVTHERHRRGVMFGVDGELADGAGPAGGGRIDAAAGEVDSGARLAACRWLGPAKAKRPASNRRGGGTLVRQVACGGLGRLRRSVSVSV
jgi:hypothetical protein